MNYGVFELLVFLQYVVGDVSDKIYFHLCNLIINLPIVFDRKLLS
jgi:hypothetical protein